MIAMSFSETRANFKAVCDRVVADHAPVVITRQRGEAVVLVSQSDWDSMQETLYLLRSPANAKRLLESIAELEAGGGEEHALIDPA
jgi:antitoxin YefM